MAYVCHQIAINVITSSCGLNLISVCRELSETLIREFRKGELATKEMKRRLKDWRNKRIHLCEKDDEEEIEMLRSLLLKVLH